MRRCEACSGCTLPLGHPEAHDCDCADRWTPRPWPEDWVEKAEAGRAAWEAMGAVERDELLLEVRFDDPRHEHRPQDGVA
jgi:hypothetical protein